MDTSGQVTGDCLFKHFKHLFLKRWRGMDRNVTYKTLFVDIKLLGLHVSSLVSPTQSTYYKMRSLKTKCCDLLRSLKHRLAQQITGIRTLITYHHGEMKGIWHESKYKLLPRLSRCQLKAGYRLAHRRLRNNWSPNPTPTSHLRSLPVSGRKVAGEAELLCG